MKTQLLEELRTRREQLIKLRDAIVQQEEITMLDERALALLRRADMSFEGVESRINSAQWEEALYLYTQGVWNLGCAHGMTRRL